jgi:hypothetical protein
MHPPDPATPSAAIRNSGDPRAMGAPETCHVIGEREGEDMDLLTVLSCIPGKLAYFAGEIRERFLLVRD